MKKLSTWRGNLIEDMSKEELIEVLNLMFNDLEFYHTAGENNTRALRKRAWIAHR